MSEPRDCVCTNCHCPQGTRNPDGLCRKCANGECVGDPKNIHESAFMHLAHAHQLPPKVYK